MADRVLPPVGPRVVDAHAYEREVRRKILDPFVASTVGRLQHVDRTWYAIRDALNALPPQFPTAQAEALVRKNLAQLDASHRRRFFRSVVKAVGIDVRRELMSSVTKPLIIRGISTNVDLIRTIGPRYHAALKGDLEKLAGTVPFDERRLAGVLRKGYKSAGYNLRRITRDQTNKLTGQFNLARQTAIGIRAYQWRTAGDERVRPSHAALDGTRQEWDAPPMIGHPGHEIQCFPGWMRLTPAGLQTSVSYRYVGELIEMTLTDGVQITTTPNHPILTETGWKRADLVEHGDQLLIHRGSRRMSGPDPDMDHRHPSAEQIHRLVGGTVHRHGSHPRHIDLHGHAARREEIDVVHVNGALRDRLQSRALQHDPDLALVLPDVCDRALATLRGPATGNHSLAAVAGGLVRGLGELLPFPEGRALHADAVRLRPGPGLEPEIMETGGHNAPSDSQPPAHGQDGLPGLVSPANLWQVLLPAFAPTRVGVVSRSWHDGPVYSVETDSGLIIANGIVTHNCRCVALGIVTAERRSRGASAPAAPPQGAPTAMTKATKIELARTEIGELIRSRDLLLAIPKRLRSPLQQRMIERMYRRRLVLERRLRRDLRPSRPPA